MSKKQGRPRFGKKMLPYILLAVFLMIGSGCSPKETATPVQSSEPAVADSAQVSVPKAMDFFAKQTYKKPKHADEKKPKILFLGNSFIYTNELPKMFAALAKSGGIQADIAEYSDGGYRLELFADPNDPLGSKVQNELMTYKYDYVILQEQSRIPSLPGVEETMYPYAITLDQLIQGAHAQTVFLMTWAYENGDNLNEFGIDLVTTREQMQTQIAQSYATIADKLNALLSPVGIAFMRSAQQHPEIELWGEDQQHPTPAGTYLASCVLYASLFDKSPVGLKYSAELNAKTAAILQQIAGDLVIGQK